MPAPPGKDAGSKVWLCHIEIRGRSLAVIGARRFGCNVCGRPTRPRTCSGQGPKQQLGLETVAGGRHDGMGTHNRIVALGDGYLDLLAVADAHEAAGSELGAALLARIEDARRGLMGWAVARLRSWLGGAQLPVRTVAGLPAALAVGIGERELRGR